MSAVLTKPTQKSATTKAGPPPLASPAAAKFRRIQSETISMPRDRAAQVARDHASLPNSPTERNLDTKRVHELVERIKGGVWLPCGWATVLFDGVKYRMNGRHSATAMVEAAEHLPEQVAVHIDHYEADDREGMAMLFRQFDARFSARSKQDVAGAYQGLVKELDQIPKGKAKLGMEGIAWYERSIEGLPVPGGDELYGLFFRQSYHPFLRWMDKILSIKTPELLRASIVAAMYATFITSESGAQEFWTHAAKQDLPDDSDPRSVLSAELVRIKEERKVAKPPTPAEFYAKCIKAWNAFRAGEKIRTLNVNTKKGMPEIAA